MRHRLVPIILPLLCAAALTGCAGKFTRENYERVRLGEHDRADVRELLGPPKTEFGRERDEWFYDDEKRGCSARVFFSANGTVAGKQWIDANTGEWSGSDSGPEDGRSRDLRAR